MPSKKKSPRRGKQKSLLEKYNINPADILYCRADDCYTHIYFKDNIKITVSACLKHVQQALPDNNFARCNRSFLVNTKQISYKDNGLKFIELINGTKVNVSRRNKVIMIKIY